jgi:N-acyl-D-amino-acid deacylase
VACNEVFVYDRGRLSPGLAADIVVFDYNQIVDRATFIDPHAPAEGMRYVLVNGRLVLENGQYTGAKPGRVLRGPGYKK